MENAGCLRMLITISNVFCFLVTMKTHSLAGSFKFTISMTSRFQRTFNFKLSIGPHRLTSDYPKPAIMIYSTRSRQLALSKYLFLSRIFVAVNLVSTLHLICLDTYKHFNSHHNSFSSVFLFRDQET